jgi:transposase
MVLDWPPYSPDLNPIEHLWAQLKQWINEYYPDLITMGKSEEAYQRLFQAIREGWEAISQEAIKILSRAWILELIAYLTQKDGTHASK